MMSAGTSQDNSEMILKTIQQMSERVSDIAARQDGFGLELQREIGDLKMWVTRELKQAKTQTPSVESRSPAAPT